MMTHTIRLRGPWRLQPTASPTNEPTNVEIRTDVPGDWGEAFGNDYRGRAGFRRVFHRPTGLEAGDAVFLVVEQIRSLGQVHLNGQLLGEAGPTLAEFDITAKLDEPNELMIDVEHPATGGPNGDGDLPGGIVGEVRLEIRPA